MITLRPFFCAAALSIIACIAAGIASLGSKSGAAEPGEKRGAKVSAYAPANDLAEALRLQATRIAGLLEKPDDYDLARQSRIAKEAEVTAVVALAIGLSDEEHPLKSAASSAVAAAQALAKAEKYEEAKEALESLKRAAAGMPAPASAVRKLEWAPIAPLGLLMKQVPIVHSNLKRSIQPERFQSQAKSSAATAATLAAIAMESATDFDAVKKPAERPQWVQYCDEMRDAAGNVDQGIHAGDAGRAETAMKRLAESCDHCHRAFRGR